MQQPVLINRIPFSLRPKLIWAGLVTVISILLSTFIISTAQAATNNTINFQARLETNSGAVVPDGNYNVEFKLYSNVTPNGTPDQGVCKYNGGTTDPDCLWVETRTSSNKVRVANGYLTADLGAVNSFPGTINWDQNLYLSIRIGGTGSSPGWDAEMSPRLHLTAVPYAFQAQSAEQLQTLSNGHTGTLQFSSLTGGDQTFQLPNLGVAGTYGLMTLQTSTNVQQSGSFNISGTGTAVGGLVAGSGSLTTAAIQGTSNSGVGIQGTSTSNYGIYGMSTAGTAGLFQSASNTNTAATLVSQQNGTATGDLLEIQNSSGSSGILDKITSAGELYGYASSASALYIGSSTNPVLRVSTTANSNHGQVILGAAGANTGVLQFLYGTAAHTGSIVLTPADPSTTNYTLTLPAETGTLCTSATSSTTCTNNYAAASGSANYIQNQNSGAQTSANFNISGTGTAVGGLIAGSGSLSTAGVQGTSNSSYGLQGTSTSSFGVYGNSTSSYGIVGNSTNYFGIIGETSAASGSISGLYGLNNGGGPGVTGVTSSATTNVAAIVGNNLSSGYGVEGIAASGIGIYGQSSTGISGYFQSSSSTNTVATLISRQNGTATGDLFEIQNTSGSSGILDKITSAGELYALASSSSALFVGPTTSTQTFGVSTTGNGTVTIGNGTTGNSNPVLLLLNSSTNTSPTEAEGAMYYDSGHKSFRCGQSGAWVSCTGLAYSQTSVAGGDTLTNPTAYTAFSDSYTIPANDCQPGVTYLVTANGTFNIGVSGGNSYALTLGTYLGSTQLHSTGSASGDLGFGTLQTAVGWQLTGEMVCDTTGSSGTAEYHATVTLGANKGSVDYLTKRTSTITLNTTTSQVLTVQAQFGTSDATNNAITMRQFIVQRFGP